MEKEDHLDKKIAISFEWSKSGLKASAESRTLSGIDRLFGSVADYGSAFIEAATDRRREKTLGERALINAAAQYGVQKMELNEPFAQRAFDKHFSKVVNAQENKDEVVFEALDDLRSRSINDDEASAGPEKLSEEFLDRFERYAEDASSDELRQRWGRVLAGEIRKPGTFNRKVLRSVDELEGKAAILFEGLAKYSFGGGIVRPVIPELRFADIALLVESGLIIDPGAIGHIRQFDEAKDSLGQEIWTITFGRQLITIPKNLDQYKLERDIIIIDKGIPSLPVLILTDVGKALCSILPAPDKDVVRRYYTKLISIFPPENVHIYVFDKDNKNWTLNS